VCLNTIRFWFFTVNRVCKKWVGFFLRRKKPIMNIFPFSRWWWYDDHHRKGSQRILHIYLSYTTTQEEWLNKVNCIFLRNLLNIFFFSSVDPIRWESQLILWSFLLALLSLLVQPKCKSLPAWENGRRLTPPHTHTIIIRSLTWLWWHISRKF